MKRWIENRWFSLLALTLLVGGVSSVPQKAWAQAKEYRVLEPAPGLFILPSDPSDVQRAKKDKIRNVQTQVQEVLQGKTPLAEKQTVLENWYTSYLFPKLTLYSPEALAELAKERELFNKVMAEYATDPNAHEFVVSLTLKELIKIVNDDFHPAVRYNAMLMITDLNKVEMNRKGETPTPAEIYLPALQFMLKELENKEQIEYVRIAALIGLVRHTSLEVYNNRAKSSAGKIPNPEWDRIRKNAFGILRQEKPAADEDPQGHQWLRRRSMEILGWMAAARPEPEIVKELIARVGNSKEYRGVRCEAAFALGNTLYTGPVNAKPPEIAANIARFIVDAVEEDITRIKELKSSSDELKKLHSAETAVSGTIDPTLGPRGPRRGVTLVDPYEYRLDPTRRRLKHEIGCAMYGLIGTREKKRSALEPMFGLLALYKPRDDREPRNPKEKEYIDGLAKLLQEVAKSSEADDTSSYIKNTHTKAEELLQKILSAGRAEPAAAAPAAAPAEAPAAKAVPVAEPSPE